MFSAAQQYKSTNKRTQTSMHRNPLLPSMQAESVSPFVDRATFIIIPAVHFMPQSVDPQKSSRTKG
jgi:hypothetical protein